MANDPREDIVINPELFFVPDDVIDVRGGTGETNPDIPEQPEPDTIVYFDDVDFDAEEDASNPSDVSALQTPQWLTVVEQSVRIAPDGRSLVDITFEVEEVAGALDYELRVAV